MGNEQRNNQHQSMSDGLANTDAIMALTGATYPAAAACRALSAKWYLPAYDEMVALRTSKDIGVLAGTLPDGRYWTSTEYVSDTTRAREVEIPSPTWYYTKSYS